MKFNKTILTVAMISLLSLSLMGCATKAKTETKTTTETKPATTTEAKPATEVKTTETKTK